MSNLNEVVPRIWMWSLFDEERQIDFNGHCVFHEGESVLIDPVEMDSSDFDRLKQLLSEKSDYPLKAILLTNLHHERDSARLKKLFSVPVWIHEKDAKGLEETPDQTFADGDLLPCGLKVIRLPDQKTAGESVFYLPARKTLIVGDALIGRVAGKVNLLPPEKYADIGKARAGLAPLTALDFETMLLGDGHSILEGASEVIMRFLENVDV